MLWELVKRRSNRQKNTVKITPREARQCHVECYLHTSSIHLTGPPGAAAERSSHIFCAWVQVQRPRKIIAQTITVSVLTPGCARWSQSLRGKSEPSLACYLLFSDPSKVHPPVLRNGCGALCILAAEVLRIKHMSLGKNLWIPRLRSIFCKSIHRSAGPLAGHWPLDPGCGGTSVVLRSLSYIPKVFTSKLHMKHFQFSE